MATEKLRREELVTLGSRIRVRLHTAFASRDEPLGCLEHLMAEAGNAGLMTAGLCQTLCDHAMGNYRVLTQMASELLAAAAQHQLDQLDEKLFLELFGPPINPPGARRHAEEPVMISYPCNDQTPMPPLSDEAAVMVLEFLQRFTECFESRYYGEIHSYYEEQSQAHRKAADPPSVDGPTF